MPYAYAAGLWCDDCGEAVCKDLDAGGLAPADPNDESSYDSDDYPKYVHEIGESDTIGHCASGEDCLNAIELDTGDKVGAWLENELTDEGIDWLQETLLERPRSDYQVALHDLWRELYPNAVPEESDGEDEDVFRFLSPRRGT